MGSKKRKFRHNPSHYKSAWSSQVYRARRYGAEGGFRLEDWILMLEQYSPDGACLDCGERGPLTIDHITPFVRGGSNWPHNLQPLCRTCNARKKFKVIDFRPDKGAFAMLLTEECKAYPGPWQKIVYLKPIWERREKERGKVISYYRVGSLTGISQRFLYRLKFGFGEFPSRSQILALCDFFFCQPNEIIFDTLGQRREHGHAKGDGQQLMMFDYPV